jgi:hypothetical protein
MQVRFRRINQTPVCSIALSAPPRSPLSRRRTDWNQYTISSCARCSRANAQARHLLLLKSFPARLRRRTFAGASGPWLQCMFDRHKTLEDLYIGHQVDAGHIFRTSVGQGAPARTSRSERDGPGDDRCNEQHNAICVRGIETRRGAKSEWRERGSHLAAQFGDSHELLR